MNRHVVKTFQTRMQSSVQYPIQQRWVFSQNAARSLLENGSENSSLLNLVLVSDFKPEVRSAGCVATKL